MPSVSELLAQKAAIEQQIADAQRAERAGAVAQVRALMAEHGLTMADLSSKAATVKRTGAKVAAKYRDGATGNTWSGRGLQPKWLKQALASGKKYFRFRPLRQQGPGRAVCCGWVAQFESPRKPAIWRLGGAGPLFRGSGESALRMTLKSLAWGADTDSSLP